MDAKWLQETLGAPLASGLTKLSFLQLDDPLEYLGNYLILYAAKEEEKRKQVSIRAKIEAAEVKQERSTALQHEQESQVVKEASENEARFAKILGALSLGSAVYPSDDVAAGDMLQDEFKARLQGFIHVLKSRLNAKSVYIGKHADDGNIEYIAGSRGAKHIIGQVQVAEIDDEGAPTEYPFVVFEPPPPLDEQEEEGDMEEEYDEEGNLIEKPEPPPRPPPLPTFVHCENVLKDPKVKVFGVPKQGAYLAINLPFESALHQGSLPNVNDVGEAQSDSEEAETAASWTPNVATKSFVVCADTMGAGRAFTMDEIAAAREMVAEFSKGLSAISLAQFSQEMKWVSELESNKESNEALIVNAMAEAQEAAKTKFEEFEQSFPEESEESKGYKEASFVLEEYKKILGADWVTQGLELLKRLWLEPSETICLSLLSCLQAFQKVSSEQPTLNWLVDIKSLSVEELLSCARDSSYTEFDTEQLESLSQKLDLCGTVESVRGEHAATGALFAVAHALIDTAKAYRINEEHKAELAEQAAAEAAAAAEEEAEEE